MFVKYFWIREKTTKTKKQYKIIANYVFAKDTFLYVLNNGNQESIVSSEINIKLQIEVISIFEFQCTIGKPDRTLTFTLVTNYGLDKNFTIANQGR